MPNLLEPFFPEGPFREGETYTYPESYIICMTARVGSTALVSALESAGLTKGAIREIFSPREEMGKLNEEYRAKTFVEYLNKHRDATNPGGPLIFKTTWWDLDEALRFARFPYILPEPKFVFIERKDRVAQAYSLWKANEYGVWHRPKDEGYSSPVDKEVPVDRIKAIMANLEEEYRQWRRFFEFKQVEPLTVYYEDFRDDLQAATEQVYEYFTGEKLDRPAESYLIKSSDDKDRAILGDLHRRLAEERSN